MNIGRFDVDSGLFRMRIYTGFLEGLPTPKDSEHEIEELKKIAKSFCWLDPHVHLNGIDINTKFLPPFGYVAWVTDDVEERHACIIWFDDFMNTPEQSIKKMLNEINWKKVSKTFSW